MVKSGAPFARGWCSRSELSSSWAVGTVGWAHAFFGCQGRQARLEDERITSVLKGTEWLIPLQPLDTQSLKLSHFLPPGTNNTFPTYNNFHRITKQISLRTMETGETQCGTGWQNNGELARVSKCHLSTLRFEKLLPFCCVFWRVRNSVLLESCTSHPENKIKK